MLPSISVGYLSVFNGRLGSSLRRIPQNNRQIVDKFKLTGAAALSAFGLSGSTRDFSRAGSEKPAEAGQARPRPSEARIGTKRPPKQSLSQSHNRGPATMAGNGNATDAGLNRETDDSIIWIDCEMTGLDIEKDLIMEVACIITNSNLDEVARLSSIVIHVPEERLKAMDAWCLSHHSESGLTEDCKKSQVTTVDAEKTLLSFVQKHTRPGKCPVGGNSVCYDRLFLQRYMPTLYSHFHYRSIDVSTIKELARRWYPKEYNLAGSQKRWIHRTMADIEDSINELRSYKANVFKQP